MIDKSGNTLIAKPSEQRRLCLRMQRCACRHALGQSLHAQIYHPSMHPPVEPRQASSCSSWDVLRCFKAVNGIAGRTCPQEAHAEACCSQAYDVSGPCIVPAAGGPKQPTRSPSGLRERTTCARLPPIDNSLTILSIFSSPGYEIRSPFLAQACGELCLLFLRLYSGYRNKIEVT